MGLTCPAAQSPAPSHDGGATHTTMTFAFVSPTDNDATSPTHEMLVMIVGTRCSHTWERIHVVALWHTCTYSAGAWK